MTIYQHRTSMTTSSGSTSSTSLRIRGGLCRQLLIVANTATTVFRVNIVDGNSYTIENYGFSTGELNEKTAIPMAGTYTINITNASPDDTFKILLGVEE